MDPFYQFLVIKCGLCKDDLIRIAQSETDDRVVCPTCFAVGDYKRKSAGLIPNVFVSDDMKKRIEQLRARRALTL